jgi:hypothetical protein
VALDFIDELEMLEILTYSIIAKDDGPYLEYLDSFFQLDAPTHDALDYTDELMESIESIKGELKTRLDRFIPKLRDGNFMIDYVYEKSGKTLLTFLGEED